MALAVDLAARFSWRDELAGYADAYLEETVSQ